MKNIFFLLNVFFLFCFSSCYGGAPANPSAADILKAADNIRNPSESYFLKIEIDSTESPDDLQLFLVGVKSNSKTLIETVQPTRDRGRNLLMLDQNMWAFAPSSKKAEPLLLNQKLSGQAANGSISGLRSTGDYSAIIENQDDKNWILLLTAVKEGLTYDKLRLWVQKETFNPQKAEYLSKEGKVLKKATYQGYRELEGKKRPSEIVIENASKPSDKSVIKILDMRVKSFPEAIFTENSLSTQHLR